MKMMRSRSICSHLLTLAFLGGGVLCAQDKPNAPPAPVEDSGEVEEAEERKGGLFRRSLDRIKEKTPGSVESITGGLGELKDKLRKTIEERANLQKEVDELKESNSELLARLETLEAEKTKLEEGMLALKDELATTKARLIEGTDPSSVGIRAEDLSKAYDEDSKIADKLYFDSYLSVVGRVKKFKQGTAQETYVILHGAEGGPEVVCAFYKDDNFFVDTLVHEGRMVNRSDGTTFLVVGKQVTIKGTCKGKGIDVELRNCEIEGLRPKPPKVKEEKKK